MNRRSCFRRGMSFVEVVVWVAVIVGVLFFGLPRFKESQRLGKSKRSGYQLKAVNEVIGQWTIEHRGPPFGEVDYGSGRVVEVDDEQLPFPIEDKEWIKQVIVPYLNASSKGKAFEMMRTVHRIGGAPEGRPYEYGVYRDGTTRQLKGVLTSPLNGVRLYEPEVPSKSVTVSGVEIEGKFVNGYEDYKFWMTGMPEY